MNDIRFRLAKPSDAKQIANCHWHVRDRYIRIDMGELGTEAIKYI